MSGSENYTSFIGIKNLSQPFENPISASLFILLIVLGILGITSSFCLICKFLEKIFYHHATASITPIFNIGTYHRRVSTVVNIPPAHCDRKPCMSVWTGQDRKAKFEDGHAQTDQIKSKNPTNASEEKGKNLLEVPSLRKLDVIKLSELVDQEEKPCMSVWTRQDRKSKFENGHVQPDQIKSKNPTNASEEKEKTPLEVPSFGKLDVMELSELVDHKEKIM